MQTCLYLYFSIAVIWFFMNDESYTSEIEDFLNAIFWPLIVLKYVIKWLINYFKTF